MFHRSPAWYCDPNDDMVIACALAAAADYVVTRDKDLLSRGIYEGIRMVTPRQFLDLIGGGSAGRRPAR